MRALAQPPHARLQRPNLCQTPRRRGGPALPAPRHIGLDNVYVSNGGFHALAGYLDAKTPNPVPKPAAAQ